MAGKERLPRGVRNNNPGNIRRNPANKWQGAVPPEARKDPEFEEFKTPEFGIRALAVLLINYQDRHGLRTIRKIIERWAPPTENNTAAYVFAVARMTGRGVDEVLDLHEYRDLRPLVEAIIAYENDGYRYPRHVVDKALEMAGVPPERKVVKTDTVRGSAVATAATTVAAVAPQLAGADWRVAVAVVLVVAVLAFLGIVFWRGKRP